MLKIKDNVDLKELEKFGYEQEYEYEEYLYAKYFEYSGTKIFIFPNKEIVQGEFIIFFGYNEVELEKKFINDLIEAGLVEKVKE